MRERALYVIVAIFFALLSACTQSPQAVTLRSLQASGRTAFLCLGRNYQPRNLEDCPDLNPVDDEARRPYALVTQRARGEVALVNISFGAGGVVDEEPSVPGFNFLPVGAQPTAIVSTPGGVASFVGVAEVGKEGIFALPTSCIAPRAGSQQFRDLTTWPACRLPSAPGEMALLLDPTRDTSCDGVTTRPAPDTQCPADLSTETKWPGQRRKLAVALPDGAVRGGPGGIAIYDAQALLDTPPGAFEPCKMERFIPLTVSRPAGPIAERLPPDDPDLNSPGFHLPTALPHGPDESFSPRPAGFAQVDDPTTGEHRLFVADLDAPVIHDLDTSDPCDLHEAAPLLPWSFADPGRTVTTKKVAASPLTTDGKRYLYAIDELGGDSVEIGGLGGGTVMIFDVSPGSTEKTPLVRPNSKRTPFEAPDRLAFAAPAEDVAFGMRDPAIQDVATGAGQVGTLCDPNPAIDVDSPPAKYRPAADFSSGAGPGNLRGVFGFLALSSGQIAVMDVEDFDAKCRRPIQTNSSATEDFRGCSADATGGTLTIPSSAAQDVIVPLNSVPTVTNEASCRAVEPHRARSGSLVLTTSDLGIRAPALRAFPKLVDVTGQALSVDASPAGRKHPRMLGVNFSAANDARAQVYVGTTLFTAAAQGSGRVQENQLFIDPASKQTVQNSLVLSFAEPRTYAPSEGFSARFEGKLFERPAGRFDYQGGVATITDGGLVFCDWGVEDQATTTLRGADLGVATGGDLDTFATGHADYVRITSELVAATDAYWSSGAVGATCGGYAGCASVFGPGGQLSNRNRELRIVRATPDTLTVESRVAPSGSAGSAAVSERLACCFPEALSYEVRASNEWVVRGNGLRHNIHAVNGVCTADPSPLKALFTSRVVEVSCDGTSADCVDDKTGKPTSIGLASESRTSRDVACVVQHPSTDTQTLGVSPLSKCIYTGLPGNFVIYRGQDPSARDMEFDWTVAGGFVPLTINLASSDSNSSPESMVFSPELGQLVVTNGVSSGLVLVDLATLGTQQFY